MASDSTQPPQDPRFGPPDGVRPRLDPTGPPPGQAPLAPGNVGASAEAGAPAPQAPLAPRNAVGRRWGIPALIAWVTLSAFAGALWFAYEQGVRKGMETGFPVVRADDGPVKIRPDDPGGLEVPHRDKRIYERMAGGDEASPEEEARLRPEPEQPVTREALLASSATEEGDAAGTAAAPVPPPPRDEVESGLGMAGTTAAPVPPPKATDSASGGSSAAPAEAQMKPETTAAPVPPPKAAASASGSSSAAPAEAQAKPETAEASASEPPAEEVAPPPPPPPSAPAETKAKPARQASVAPPPRQAVASRTEASGRANRSRPRIQIGSYRSAEEAERAWKRLNAREKPILGALDPLVARADLGDRGIFYRLQAGPFESVKAARAACARLEQRKLGCLVVRPAAR